MSRTTLCVLAVLVTGIITAQADVVNGPGRAFSLTLPGAWSVATESDDAVAWSGKGSEDAVLHVIAARAELDATKPFAPQLIEAAKADADLPNARDFVETDVVIQERETPMVAFVFDGPEGAKLQGCGAAFTAGQCIYLVFVIGEPGPYTWVDARAILSSVGPPSENAAATGGGQAAQPLLGRPPIAEGASPDGVPEGWLWRQAPNGMAVQVFRQAQPGAVAEVCIVTYEGRSAAKLLRDGFYTPLADQLQAVSVQQSADDAVAVLKYERKVGEVALRGEALTQIGQGAALMAHIAAPAEGFTEAAQEARRLLLALAAGTQAAAGEPVTPLAIPPLEERLCADGSARISVPAGWTVAGISGMIEAESPDGLHVSVGLHSQLADRTVAARLAAGGLDPTLSGTIYMDYLPPEQAAPMLMTYISRAGGVQIDNPELVTSAVLPDVPGFASFEMKWREHARDGQVHDRHAMGIVTTQPPLDGVWSYYMTLVSAPPGKLQAAMPLLLAVARSASWTAEFNAAAWERIRADTNETADIIAGVAQRRSEFTDTAARMWGAVIRGDEGVINEATGERRLIRGLDGMQRWMSADPNVRLGNLRPMNFEEWRTADF